MILAVEKRDSCNFYAQRDVVYAYLPNRLVIT